MAQGALTAGSTVPRKRAMFGLLDADGWAWATAKAIAWLTFIILILGYIPDRAYYLTVSRTVDLGVLAWSPINLCPPENQTLPCPAPVGAIVPWATSPTAARPAGGPDRRRRRPARHAAPLHRRVRRHDRAVHGLCRQDGRHRQLRRVGAGPAAPRAED